MRCGERSVCRQRKNEIAESFLAKVGSDLAAVVVLRDIVPLLLPMGKEAALVDLSIAKANSQVRHALRAPQSRRDYSIWHPTKSPNKSRLFL